MCYRHLYYTIYCGDLKFKYSMYIIGFTLDAVLLGIHFKLNNSVPTASVYIIPLNIQ